MLLPKSFPNDNYSNQLNYLFCDHGILINLIAFFKDGLIHLIMRPHLILFLAVIAISCNRQPDKSGWKLIYKTDKAGVRVSGDKGKLIELVRKGNPVRVGWMSRRPSDTTKSVEHIVDGDFLTIANGKELFVQITPFLAQRPDLTSDTISMTLMPTQLNWVLGTNGIISTINIDYQTDSVSTGSPRLFGYELSWFVDASE
ncbi:MAG: hypothetical protein KDC99_17190 [Cyclobacteriaceae bacterium]|nr:hypothetical protein [Cyclobacteriaceae bacterium]